MQQKYNNGKKDVKLKQIYLKTPLDLPSLSEILYPTAESCRTPLWGGIIGIDLFKIC